MTPWIALTAVEENRKESSKCQRERAAVAGPFFAAITAVLRFQFIVERSVRRARLQTCQIRRQRFERFFMHGFQESRHSDIGLPFVAPEIVHRFQEIFFLLPRNSWPDRVAFVIGLMAASAIDRVENLARRFVIVGARCLLVEIWPWHLGEMRRQSFHVFFAQAFRNGGHELVFAMTNLKIIKLVQNVGALLPPYDRRRLVDRHPFLTVASRANLSEVVHVIGEGVGAWKGHNEAACRHYADDKFACCAFDHLVTPPNKILLG